MTQKQLIILLRRSRWTAFTLNGPIFTQWTTFTVRTTFTVHRGQRQLWFRGIRRRQCSRHAELFEEAFQVRSWSHSCVPGAIPVFLEPLVHFWPKRATSCHFLKNRRLDTNSKGLRRTQARMSNACSGQYTTEFLPYLNPASLFKVQGTSLV